MRKIIKDKEDAKVLEATEFRNLVDMQFHGSSDEAFDHLANFILNNYPDVWRNWMGVS